jgi:hypothetical protein
MTGMHHRAQPLIKIGVGEFSPHGWPGTAILPIPASQIARITGLSHCTWRTLISYTCSSVILIKYILMTLKRLVTEASASEQSDLLDE